MKITEDVRKFAAEQKISEEQALQVGLKQKTPPPEAKAPATQLIRYADELCTFLKSDEQKVFLLHGRWGTGKTYFWTHFIEAEQSTIKELFYSYAPAPTTLVSRRSTG
jgi:hypothetical protein